MYRNNYYQMGGQPQMAPQQQEDPQQKIIQIVAQMLQQGMAPEQIVQQLAKMGLPPEQAQQIVVTVMQEMQQGEQQVQGQPQEEQAGQPEEPEMQPEMQAPMQRYGGLQMYPKQLYQNGGIFYKQRYQGGGMVGDDEYNGGNQVVPQPTVANYNNPRYIQQHQNPNFVGPLDQQEQYNVTTAKERQIEEEQVVSDKPAPVKVVNNDDLTFRERFALAQKNNEGKVFDWRGRKYANVRADNQNRVLKAIPGTPAPTYRKPEEGSQPINRGSNLGIQVTATDANKAKNPSVNSGKIQRNPNVDINGAMVYTLLKNEKSPSQPLDLIKRIKEQTGLTDTQIQKHFEEYNNLVKQSRAGSPNYTYPVIENKILKRFGKTPNNGLYQERFPLYDLTPYKKR